MEEVAAYQPSLVSLSCLTGLQPKAIFLLKDISDGPGRWKKKTLHKPVNVAFNFLGYSDQDVLDLQFQSFHNPQLLFVSYKSLLTTNRVVCLWLLLKITRVASIATANPVGFREVGFCRLKKKSNWNKPRKSPWNN